MRELEHARLTIGLLADRLVEAEVRAAGFQAEAALLRQENSLLQKMLTPEGKDEGCHDDTAAEGSEHP